MKIESPDSVEDQSSESIKAISDVKSISGEGIEKELKASPEKIESFVAEKNTVVETSEIFLGETISEAEGEKQKSRQAEGEAQIKRNVQVKIKLEVSDEPEILAGDNLKEQTPLEPEATGLEIENIIVMPVKIENNLNSNEATWTAQEPHAVSELSSEAANDDFHSMDSTAEVFESNCHFMDSSIISVAESPPVMANKPKDSTFSPVVDTSIQDSRPTIEDGSSTKRVNLRTSTPLVQRIMKFTGVNTPKPPSFHESPKISKVNCTPRRIALKDTPKRMPGVSYISSGLSTKKIASIKEDELFEIESKLVNPLEKSILKSSRRKRSLSVADGESFMQKKVVFISPQIMDINDIDEKMMASFIGEKENSIMKSAVASSHRKRSLSTGTPAKPKEMKAQSRVKMPNFKAIHEQQFQKMESIADHANRKAERAKKLVTPVRATEIERPKLKAASKIPTMTHRKPLEVAPSNEILAENSKRVTKRSLSSTAVDEPPIKKMQFIVDSPASLAGHSGGRNAKKIAVVTGLQRAYSEDSKNFQLVNAAAPTTTLLEGLNKKPTSSTSTQSVAQLNRTKIEERRERNMGLYKSNQVQRTTSDMRSKNVYILKGVRLNRRFELQMQHRRDQDDA